MTYGRSILEDIRLAEEAGMVFPVAEVEVASEDDKEGDGLEGLTVPELRRGGWCLGWCRWAQTVISDALGRGWKLYE